MTRVIWWNMYNFGINKIGDPLNRPKPPSLGLPGPEGRLDQIRRLFTETQPDIFIMLELHSRNINVPVGQLVKSTQAGGKGSLQLLADIRKFTKNDKWFLVPPIVTGSGGKAEGVGVYYNSLRVEFTGPWQYNGKNGTGPKTTAAAADYPDPWKKASGNNNLGGQWNFLESSASSKAGGGAKKAKVFKSINFPISGERTPWLTTFKEIAVPNRQLEIFALHAPAPGPNAPIGTAALATVSEFESTLKPNTVRALGGDFNVDANNTSQRAKSYQKLVTAASYQWLFGTAVPQTPAVYYKTSLRTVGKSSIGNTYPDYGYGVNAYDQIFVRGTVVNPGTSQRIINPITGTSGLPKLDYAGYPKPNGTFTAAYGYPGSPTGPPGPTGFTLYTTPPAMDQNVNTLLDLGTVKATRQFKLWDNYGKIRSTSDHLAVVVDL